MEIIFPLSDNRGSFDGWKDKLSSFCNMVEKASPNPDSLKELAKEFYILTNEQKLLPPQQIEFEYNEIMKYIKDLDIFNTQGVLDLSIESLTPNRKTLLDLMKSLCIKLNS